MTDEQPTTIAGMGAECEQQLAATVAGMGSSWTFRVLEARNGIVVDVLRDGRARYRQLGPRLLEACEGVLRQLDEGPPPMALRLAAGTLSYEPTADVWEELAAEVAQYFEEAPPWASPADVFGKPGPLRVIGAWRRRHRLDRDPITGQ